MELLESGLWISPGTGDDVEAFHGEINGCGISALVMPVTNEDVLGDEVDGAEGVVFAGFPFAEASGFTIQQTVAPNPELARFGLEVVVKELDLTGEELGLVLAATARAFGFANVKHFVHAGVKGVGLENIAELIDEREDDFVDLGMQGTVAAAIETIGIGPGVFLGGLDPGCFIKFGVDLE